MDKLSPEQRSENMRRIRGKDTRPEMVVRRLLYGMGYRYRLHQRILPGCPDLVFFGRKKVVFVHGCFWHLHQSCKIAHFPATRQDYWRQKLESNKRRDERTKRTLRRRGWTPLIVWECETRDLERLSSRLRDFLQ